MRCVRLAYTLGEDDFTTLNIVRKFVDGFHGGGLRSWPPHENEIQFPSSSPHNIQALVDAIQKVVSSDTEETSIPLRCLYRQSKEYLKGFDAAICVALSPVCNVSLVPVILHKNSDHSSCGEWSESEPFLFTTNTIHFLLLQSCDFLFCVVPSVPSHIAHTKACTTNSYQDDERIRTQATYLPCIHQRYT